MIMHEQSDHWSTYPQLSNVIVLELHMVVY
jgi:hypothetical protein